MANFEDGSYSCLPGVTLISKVLAGRCKMHYSRAALGKGHIPEGVSPKELTEPPEYVMDAMIAAITNPVNGECQVTVQVNSSDVEHGFYCTGVLLYADDPDDGEVPYTYLRLEDGPEWIRPSTSIVGKLATFDLIAAVGDVDAVTATIDPNSIVTRAEIARLIADSTGQLAAQMAVRQMDLTIPATDWEKTGTGEYPYSRDIPVDGVTDRMIPGLTVLEEGESAAIACGLCPRVQTLDGVVRVFAALVPKADIPTSLTLQGDASGLILSGGTGGSIKIGSGLKMDNDGAICVDVASEAEVQQMLTGVFPADK